MARIISGNKFISAYGTLAAKESHLIQPATVTWRLLLPATPGCRSPGAWYGNGNGNGYGVWVWMAWHIPGSFLWQIFTFWGLWHPACVGRLSDAGVLSMRK